MAESVVDVTNHTRTVIALPGIPGVSAHGATLRLIPGLNRVPRAYLEALAGYSVPTVDASGKPAMVEVKDDKGKVTSAPALRYPGREMLARLTAVRVPLDLAAGKRMGYQLEIHAPGEIDPARPLGPVAPVDLPSSEEHALVLVRVTSDREALERWSRCDSRPSVKSAALAKMESLT
jgi:hypothetical protein